MTKFINDEVESAIDDDYCVDDDDFDGEQDNIIGFRQKERAGQCWFLAHYKPPVKIIIFSLVWRKDGQSILNLVMLKLRKQSFKVPKSKLL